MIRISCNRDIRTFMYNKFSDILEKYIKDKVNNLTKERQVLLNKLLKEEFKLQDINQLIQLFIDNLKINDNRQGDYYITVEDVVVNNYKLEAIIRTVDYGSSKFPPFNIFNTSLIFVNNNLEALYKYSYLGVN